MHVTGSPPQRVVGRARVDVAAEPIARMFPAEHWRQPADAGGGPVFGGRAGEVIDNLDTVTRAGVPGFTDLALVPVARSHHGVAGLHQVRVRLGASALTGSGQPATLEFTVEFDHPDRQPSA